MRNLVWLVGLLVACSGGGGDDAGGDDAGSNGPPPPNNGYVAITSTSAMSGTMPIVFGTASASFYVNQATGTCTEQVFGACTTFTCPATVPTPIYASAGTISVTGLSQAITLTPQADKTYMPFSQMQPLFTGGEMITVSGTGAEAPAFSIGVTAPSRASITSPAPPPTNGSLTINRAQDFSVMWTGGGAGKLYVYFAGPSGSGASVSCGYDASAGSATVPAAALSVLPPGMGSFGASRLFYKSVDIGDWRIYGQAFSNAVWASDLSICSAVVTLQ